MDEKLKPFYERADLSQYSLRQRLLIRMIAGAFGTLISVLGRTIRFEVEGAEYLDAIRARKTPVILVNWHENIFLSTYFMRDLGIVVITSKSFDGEYIARFLTKFGYGTVRGSSSRGGAQALVQMIRLTRAGVITGFTIDGPRGPRRVAKPGACTLAMKTGGLIYPVTIEPRRFWAAGSWDRLRIPLPFSRAIAIFGAPVAVSADAGPDELAASLAELQAKLDAMSEFGEKWRESSK